MSNYNVLPWHQPLWQSLTVQQHRVNSQLFFGEANIGKLALVENYAYFILSEDSAFHMAEDIGVVKEALNNHPDYYHIEPDNQRIKIDTIRHLNNFVNQTSMQPAGKVVVIENAECLNNAAANALLKMLEEPNDSVYFLLHCSSLSSIKQTIISRCIKHYCNGPTKQQLQQWLSLLTLDSLPQLPPLLLSDYIAQSSIYNDYQRFINGFRTFQSTTDCIKLIAEVIAIPIESLLSWIQYWLHDLMLMQKSDTIKVFHQPFKKDIQQLSMVVEHNVLLYAYQRVVELIKMLHSRISFNWKTQLQAFMLECQQKFWEPITVKSDYYESKPS